MGYELSNIIKYSLPTAVGAATLASIFLVPVQDWPRWIASDDALQTRVERGLNPNGAEARIAENLSKCEANLAELNAGFETIRAAMNDLEKKYDDARITETIVREGKKASDEKRLEQAAQILHLESRLKEREQQVQSARLAASSCAENSET